MLRTSALPCRKRSRGSAPVALLFWALAGALFVLPFLRAKDAPHWGAPDPTRKLDPFSDEDESPLDIPFAEDVAEFDVVAAEEEWELEGTLAELLGTASAERFGWETAGFESNELFDHRRVMAGRSVYIAQCAGCHGLEGDGAGPAARHLKPRPRNLLTGLFKFKTTEAGARPKRTDLFDTVTRGLVGSAMPDFRLLAEEKRWDVVEYVRYLAIRGEFQKTMLDIAWQDEELPDPAEVFEIVERRWQTEGMGRVYPTAAEPDFDEASVERGRELFNSAAGASCYSCHGAAGLGDGPSAGAFNDGWGYPIRPRDLTTGLFRAGDDGEALWRLIDEGIAGTPMPGASGTVSGEDIWHIVHFVQDLARTEDAR